MRLVFLGLLLITSTSGFDLGVLSFVKSLFECPLVTGPECPDKISYWLYTRGNVKGVKIDAKALDKVSFVEGDLKIAIHGYQNNRNSVIFKVLRGAYFAKGDVNVMVVDWGTYCKTACYAQAVKSIPVVAKCVAATVNQVTGHRRFKSVHMLGHSLGAHVAAHASEDVKPRLNRLTRFDPALPLFVDTTTQTGVAEFRDVYHSNTGVAGQTLAEGDLDVYFNSGSFQPGCKCDISCSHMRSVKYYAESINRGMKAFRCKSWDKFMKLRCPPPTKMNSLIEVGERVDMTKRGRYMVFTRRKQPFLVPPRAYLAKNRFYRFMATSFQDCNIPDIISLVKRWIGAE